MAMMEIAPENLPENVIGRSGLTESMGMYLLLAWRNIWRHPRRSLLTFLAIILGLLLFITTRAIQFGTYEKIIEKAVRTHTGYIQIHKKGYIENRSFEFTIESYDKLAKKLKEDPSVTMITGRINAEALIASDNATTGTAVVGVDAEKEFKITAISSKMKEGRLVSKAGDIMIGELMAKNLKVKAGDELVLIANGADGSLGAEKFILSGVFATGVADFDRSIVMIGIGDADMLFSMGGEISEIVVMLDDFSKVDETAVRLRAALAPEDTEVHSWKELLPEMVQLITLDNAGGLIMLWFFFIVVVAVILNTILISTLERIKEFGIMMSLGLRPSKIFTMIITEAGLLVLIGTVIGMVLAWFAGGYLEDHPFSISKTISENMEARGFSALIYTKMTFDLIITWGGAIFFVSLILVIYPALRISRMTPLHALHPGRG